MSTFEEQTETPATTEAIGTLEEAKALGIMGPALRAVHTCSEPVPGSSLGCTEWNNCPLDEAKGKCGKINVAVRRFKRNGSAFERVRNCVQFMRLDFEAFKAGARIELIGTELEPEARYLQTGTKKTHEKPDPNCSGCKAGSCALYEETFELKAIPPCPRPSATMYANETARKIAERRQSSPQEDIMARLRNNPVVNASMPGGNALDGLRPRRGRPPKNRDAESPASSGSGESAS